VRVDVTPTPQRKLTESELNAIRHPQPEPVNALLTASDEDPTYDKMVGFYRHSARRARSSASPRTGRRSAWTGLGGSTPAHGRRPRRWFLIGEKNVPFGEMNVPFKRRLHEGYLPLVTLSREIDGVEHQMTVFGWSEGFNVEKDTIAFVRFASRATSSGQVPKHIAFAWGSNADQKAHYPAGGGRGWTRGDIPALQLAAAGHRRPDQRDGVQREVQRDCNTVAAATRARDPLRRAG
jgi:hypothetical protein